MSERNIFCERLAWPQMRKAARAARSITPLAAIYARG
jgi:hypothetical protein